MCRDKRILFKNLHVVDVNSNAVQHNVSILSEGQKIAAIGKGIPEVTCDDVIDCMGMYAMPSLIDMHVHVTFNSMIDGEMSLDNVALNLAQAAHNGVCIVRDVGMSPKWSIEAVHNAMPLYPLPKIVFSGAPICVPGGHGWDYGLYVESEKIDDYMKLHKKAGFTWVKIMNDPENHSLDYMERLVRCAHYYGLKVACHVFREKGIQLAIQSKCDTIEHVVPIQVATIPEEAYYVPTAYSAWVSCKDGYLNSIPEQDAQYLIEWYNLLKDNLARAVSSGVKVLCGTDAGCCPSAFGDIVSEILTLNMLGMSSQDVLRAATTDSALCLKCYDSYGSIEVGKYANFFMVHENPLENLKTLLCRKMIVLFGTIIKNEVNVPWA